MTQIKITNNTTASDLEKFCGKHLLQFTGVTKVKTKEGNIPIEFGDTIKLNEDGTFSVEKNAD